MVRGIVSLLFLKIAHEDFILAFLPGGITVVLQASQGTSVLCPESSAELISLLRDPILSRWRLYVKVWGFHTQGNAPAVVPGKSAVLGFFPYLSPVLL